MDINPPVSYGVPPSLTQYLTVALIGLALAAVAIWLARRFLLPWMKRRRKENPMGLPMLPPHEQALERLKRLEPVEAWQEKGKAFYFELLLVFRGYVSRRFDIDALEMTTEEFLPVLKSLPMPTDLYTGARALLMASDPIKFAGIPPDFKAMKTDLAFVNGFVRQTALTVSNGQPEEADSMG